MKRPVVRVLFDRTGPAGLYAFKLPLTFRAIARAHDALYGPIALLGALPAANNLGVLWRCSAG